MAAPIFLYPNFADAPKGATPGAVLNGGDWQLPLANMQTRRYRQVARSRHAGSTATWFDVRLTAFAELRAIILGNHNFSVTARLRITAWYEGGSFYDHDYRTEVDVYPTLAFTQDLPSDAENWWDGKPLTRDIEGFKQNAIHVLPEAMSMPNWRVEIFDEGNARGYLDVGRLFMATGWQPSQALERGPTLRPEDPTNIETALSGRELFDMRPGFRVWNVAFRMMDRQELLDFAFALQRKAGLSGEMFFIFDPDDARNLTAQSFFARHRRLLDYELVNFPRANIGFELKELL